MDVHLWLDELVNAQDEEKFGHVWMDEWIGG